jgi:Resolvase, N terminal domain
MTNQPQTNQLAINEKAAIYIRVASPQVSRHTTDARELHVEQLVQYARQLGFTDETILIFDDSGIPASAPLEKRGAMQALFQALEQGEVKTLFCATEQSLFRKGNSNRNSRTRKEEAHACF